MNQMASSETEWSALSECTRSLCLATMSPDALGGGEVGGGILHYEHDRYQRFGRGPPAKQRINAHRRQEHDAMDLCRKGAGTCGDRAAAYSRK